MKDYMRPLNEIVNDTLEIIVSAYTQLIKFGVANLRPIQQMRYELEYRMDALAVVNRTTQCEQTLVQALKRLENEIYAL